MFKSILRKEKIEVIPIKVIDDKPKEWNGNGIIFNVKNGKGLLYHAYGSYENKGLYALTYDGVPLIKFLSDEYFCPTCEKLVAAGYGLNMVEDNTLKEMRELFNVPYVSLEESFVNLKPLLGLLRTGYYALIDTELFPSDGNGNFFWKVNNIPVSNKASCPVFEGGGEYRYSDTLPKYILPSQPPTQFNRDTADYYRNNDKFRAIAYFSESYLCTLLDGHHKAVAAALEHRTLKTLVIMPVSSGWEKRCNINEKQGGITFQGVNLYENEMNSKVTQVLKSFSENRMSKEEVERYIVMLNAEFDDYIWDKDILESEKFYPDVETLARLDWAGIITEEKLNHIIIKEEYLTDTQALNLVSALFALEHPRYKEISFFIARHNEYLNVWTDVYQLLSKKKDEEIENFFIEYLVNTDIERNDIKKIIDDYFEKY